MKKKLLYILFISLLLLSGCEKKSTKIAPASLFVLDGNVTSEGIRPGDGPDTLQEGLSKLYLAGRVDGCGL